MLTPVIKQLEQSWNNNLSPYKLSFVRVLHFELYQQKTLVVLHTVLKRYVNANN